MTRGRQLKAALWIRPEEVIRGSTCKCVPQEQSTAIRTGVEKSSGKLTLLIWFGFIDWCYIVRKLAWHIHIFVAEVMDRY